MTHTPSAADSPGSTYAPPGLTIRPVTEPSEFQESVAIQLDTWGHGFSDIVPTSMLQITAKMGGVVSGAFDAEGKLMGLVYGITGLRHGELAHWSHMLAVRPEVRNLGVGRALKLHQRELLREAGVGVMFWTFDPLVARNAHLNLNRLGARVDEYVPDMYGDSDSELHRLGTDRFIVRWDLTGEPSTPGAETAVPVDAPRIGCSAGSDGAPLPEADPVLVDVPRDIEQVEAASFEEAMAWRTSTRRAFLHYLDRGYDIRSFVPGDAEGHYVLSRTTD